MDMLHWELTSLEILESWDSVLAGMIENNLRVHCVTCSSKTCEVLILRHRSNGDLDSQVVSQLFDNYEEAEIWFNEQVGFLE